MPTPKWTSYNLNDAFPEAMADVAEALADAGAAIADPLLAAAELLKALGLLIVGYADPAAAALAAAILQAEIFINDLMQTGVYFTYHLPQSITDVDFSANTEAEEKGYKLVSRGKYVYDFNADGDPDLVLPMVSGVSGEPAFASAVDNALEQLKTGLRGFASVDQWCTDVADSVFDDADPSSPRFISGRVGAVALILVVPSFLDFIEPIQAILDLLFGIELNIQNLQPSINFPNSGAGRKPDWISMKLRDLPHMQQLEAIALAVIGLLRPGLDILAAVIAFGEMLVKKAEKLKALVDQIQALLTALAGALGQTGFYILKIDTSDGNFGFASALKESGDKPDLFGLDQVVGGVVLLAGGEEASVEALLGLF